MGVIHLRPAEPRPLGNRREFVGARGLDRNRVQHRRGCARARKEAESEQSPDETKSLQALCHVPTSFESAALPSNRLREYAPRTPLMNAKRKISPTTNCTGLLPLLVAIPTTSSTM